VILLQGKRPALWTARVLHLALVVLSATGCGSRYEAVETDGGAVLRDGGTGDPEAGPDDGGSGRDPACDSDQDGHLSRACGGDDCDDGDRRIHPGQDFVQEAPVSPNIGDWNCDGAVTKEHKTGVSCQVGGNLGCAIGQGFVGSPACGAEGDFITCKFVSFSCVLDQTTKAVQSCK
jgi:hypothetical protein